MTAPVTEAQRLHLFKTFEGLFPDEDVATLMAIIPPAGDDVATTSDVALVRSDLALVKSDLEAQIRSVTSDLESQIRSLKTDLEARLRATKSDLQVEVAGLRAEVHDALAKQTTRFVAWMLASNTALVTAVGVIVSAGG